MIAGSSAADAAAGAEQVACPYLGLPDDPRTRFAFADMAHRCHSGAGGKQIEITHQATFCLTARHLDCRRYVAPAPGALAAASPPAWASLARVNGTLGHRSGRDGKRAPSVRAALLGAAVITLAIVAGWFLSQGGLAPFGPADSPGASAGAGPASPALSPHPPSSSSPRPASAAPTGTATPRPTSSPRQATTHVVVRGDTLTTIAALYGVTVAALQEANEIDDPNLITIGQRLIIPAR